MIILSNESNPAALKLLIAAEFGKKTVEIKLINLLGMHCIIRLNLHFIYPDDGVKQNSLILFYNIIN